MYKNPHSTNLLLNLGIESLNEMQEMAQDANKHIKDTEIFEMPIWSA